MELTRPFPCFHVNVAVDGPTVCSMCGEETPAETCRQLTVLGNTHAERAGKLGKDVVNQYFGIFFLVFQSSGVWGNLISSLVFGQTPTYAGRLPPPPTSSAVFASRPGLGGLEGGSGSEGHSRGSRDLSWLGSRQPVACTLPPLPSAARDTTRAAPLLSAGSGLWAPPLTSQGALDRGA